MFGYTFYPFAATINETRRLGNPTAVKEARIWYSSVTLELISINSPSALLASPLASQIAPRLHGRSSRRSLTEEACTPSDRPYGLFH